MASLPFAPEIVQPTVMNFRRLNVQVANPYGFKASIHPTFSARGGPEVGWVSPFHFGINEGPTGLMIENCRSELIWKLMQSCIPIKRGLVAAGFVGGWLAWRRRIPPQSGNVHCTLEVDSKAALSALPARENWPLVPSCSAFRRCRRGIAWPHHDSQSQASQPRPGT